MQAFLIPQFSYILLYFYYTEDSLAKLKETNVDKLKSDLLQNYDRFSRPENAQVTTNVYVGLTVIHMELHETKGVLETHAWIKLNWLDGKLKWNPNDYDNITHFHVSADEVSKNLYISTQCVQLFNVHINVHTEIDILCDNVFFVL